MCFKDLESSMEDILPSFFHTLYLWIVAFLSSLSISFVDFLLYTFGVLRGALRFQ